MVNWSENTKHTLPFNYSNTTLDKKKARNARRRVRRVLIIGEARRRVRSVLLMGEARKREGAPFSRLN